MYNGGRASQMTVGRSQASRDNGRQCTGRYRDASDRDSIRRDSRDMDRGSRDRGNRDRGSRDRDCRDRDIQLPLPGHSCIAGTRKAVSREPRRVGSSTSRWVFIR